MTRKWAPLTFSKPKLFSKLTLAEYQTARNLYRKGEISEIRQLKDDFFFHGMTDDFYVVLCKDISDYDRCVGIAVASGDVDPRTKEIVRGRFKPRNHVNINVYVEKTYRQMGIGTELTKRLQKLIISHGLHPAVYAGAHEGMKKIHNKLKLKDIK